MHTGMGVRCNIKSQLCQLRRPSTFHLPPSTFHPPPSTQDVYGPTKTVSKKG